MFKDNVLYGLKFRRLWSINLRNPRDVAPINIWSANKDFKRLVVVSESAYMRYVINYVQKR